MRPSSIWIALAATALGSVANAADLAVVTRGQLQTSRPIVRLADQELGYSVLHDTLSPSPRGYRVHLTCTMDESFMQTHCPTTQYYASCPRAQIFCQ
jgi:hypothetical protein